MPKSDRIKALEAGIRQVLKPALEAEGFSYDGRHRLFRRKVGECTQIVAIQTDARSLEGNFAVNLAIFHPEYRGYGEEVSEDKARDYDCIFEFRQRLSILRDTPVTRFFRRFITNTDHWLNWWLTTPTDKWWSFGPDHSRTNRSLSMVLQLFKQKGLPWLEGNTKLDMLKSAYDARLRKAERRT